MKYVVEPGDFEIMVGSFLAGRRPDQVDADSDEVSNQHFRAVARERSNSTTPPRAALNGFIQR